MKIDLPTPKLTNNNSFMTFKFVLSYPFEESKDVAPFKVCAPMANPAPKNPVTYGTWDDSEDCCSDSGILI